MDIPKHKIMKTERNTNTNTVQTILSEQSVSDFELLLHWFLEELDHEGFTDKIMTMLKVYIVACPKGEHKFRQPEWMTIFVSNLIQLKEQLCDIMNREEPWGWVDTIEGWAKPAPDSQ